MSSLQSCLRSIFSWLSINMLVCNPEKTDIVHFTSRFGKHAPISVNVNGSTILPKPEARDLGVVLDSHLHLDTHVNNVCKAASLGIRNIGRIHKYIGKAESERLVHAFVSSKLDYCNSILYGLQDYQLKKLQRIKNTAARVVCKSKIKDHISPVLEELHWLPVKYRIVFKILLFVYKARNGLAPTYINELLDEYKPTRSRRSSSKSLLSVPRARTSTYGDCSFSIAGPVLWNSLPAKIRSITSLDILKKQ